MKKLFPILVMAVMICAFGANANAQLKMGYVNSDKIFQEYTEWSKAQEDFQTQYNAWDQEAKEMQTELEDMIDEYQRQALILSEEKKKEREAAIESKRQNLDAFTKRIFGPNGEAERKNNSLVKPLLEKINGAIEQVATEGNYDYIFNSDGLAYSKQEYDVTDKVLELLEE